jgi:hypothetical protein
MEEDGFLSDILLHGGANGVDGRARSPSCELKGVAPAPTPQKFKTCGPLIFNLLSPNNKLLEKVYFFTWHLVLKLGKTIDLPSDV